MVMQQAGGVRIPPQDIEAEKALLGSIMLRPDMMVEALEQVERGSFYIGKHNTIYNAMADLSGKGDPIDLLSLSSRLTKPTRRSQHGRNCRREKMRRLSAWWKTQIRKRAVLGPRPSTRSYRRNRT